MTTELTKAAQQALERLKIHQGSAYCNAREDEDDEVIAALERALTQRPAAQTEREAFEAWWESDGPNTSSPYEAAMSGWEAGRASLLAPQQATPEPVGEPAAWRWFNSNGDQVTNWLDFKPSQKASVDAQVAEAGGRVEYVYTRPAPGVPEGLPAVLTDWGFDVHDDEEGRTWLTIRNPDDDVARMSVPTVWPLNGNQTISAVVLHQFSAALTSALAAAQAKGAGHD